MRLLAVDTATEACSAALQVDDRVLARIDVAGRSHTQQMLPMVHGLMAEAGLRFADLSGLVCGVGPGSFAGVRIGVGFIKGLALSLGLPVVAVSSLEMLAQDAIDGGAPRVLCAIDARMDEVYLGAFERGEDDLARALIAPSLAPPRTFRQSGEGPWTAVGTGWGRYEAELRAGTDGVIERLDGTALPRAEAALRLAQPAFARGETLNADALAPLYLRDKVALTLEEQVRLREARATSGT
jgi:tRNA threonylcarbamoyladenosine biosynthesis protein TsaB